MYYRYCSVLPWAFILGYPSLTEIALFLSTGFVLTTERGNLDQSCGALCTKLLDVPGSQQMILQASSSSGLAGANLYGTIYSPRAG